MSKYELRSQDYVHGQKWALVTPAGVRCESDDYQQLLGIFRWHVGNAFYADPYDYRKFFVWDRPVLQ